MNPPTPNKAVRITAEEITPAMAVRFWAKVKKTDTCWIWTAATNGKKGYPNFATNKRSYRAIRVSYALANGECPAGLQVLHSCDNRVCVNPAHLSVGTNQANVADMITKGRHKNQIKKRCPRGHELSGDNVYSPPSHPNWRYCRTCKKEKRYELSKQ